MVKKPKITILVPIYNEENTLKSILEKVTKLPIDSYEVLVVNDASTDRSSKIIDEFEEQFKRSGVSLNTYSHSVNRGKGAGIKTGLKHAKGEYFIIQDADLEYDPKDILPMLKAAKSNELVVVYGSRFKGNIVGMAKANYYANKLYNFVLRRMYPTSITDMHTCYKMVRTDVIKNLNMTSEGFGYATELVSKLLKNGYEITEVPISFNGRTKKEGKKIDVKDGFECLYMLIKYRYSR